VPQKGRGGRAELLKHLKESGMRDIVVLGLFLDLLGHLDSLMGLEWGGAGGRVRR